MRHRKLVAGALFALAVCASLGACSLLVSTSDLAGGAPDGGALAEERRDLNDGPPPADRGGEPPDAGALTDAANGGGDAGQGGGARCPPGPGGTAPMVRAGAGCIDPYEATELEYRNFLVAKGGDMSGQPSECASNASYTPKFGAPPKTSVPITWIDWCDALAYCTWAGKRLCGAVDGGPLPPDLIGTSDDEWFLACSHNADGLHSFPYGTKYQQGVCNDINLDAQAPLPVGSLPMCQGGYPNLFDMTGNVREWVRSCATAGGPATCGVRGGAFYDISSTGGCDNRQGAPADEANVGVGFRCCATPR